MRRLFAASALALSLSLSSAAYAADTSTAEHLFSEGLAAMKREDFKAACDAFNGSNDVDPSPGTQINLAICHEKQGKIASAWGWYRTAAGLADQRGQKDRAEGARKEADKLEPKLRKLVISVKETAPNLTIVRDGSAVPSVLVGKEVPVDPGEHSIEVTAKGKRPWTTKVIVAPGPGIDRVDVPLLENAPEEKGVGTPIDAVPPVIVGSDGSTQRTVGAVVGVFGIIGILAGVGVFVLAKNEESKRDGFREEAKLPENQDPRRIDDLNKAAESRNQAAENNQLIAIVTGAGGAVLLGVGAYLFLSAPKRSSTADLKVTPLMGSGTSGFALSGTF